MVTLHTSPCFILAAIAISSAAVAYRLTIYLLPPARVEFDGPKSGEPGRWTGK